MYPPRRSPQPSVKTKFTYNGIPKGAPSSSQKDVQRINKILDNAKKYEKEKETKKNYMMEGINSIKKKKNGDSVSKPRISSRESEVSSRESLSGKKNDIYRQVDMKDRQISSSNSNGSNRVNSQQKRESQLSPRNLVTIGSGQNKKKVMLQNQAPEKSPLRSASHHQVINKPNETNSLHHTQFQGRKTQDSRINLGGKTNIILSDDQFDQIQSELKYNNNYRYDGFDEERHRDDMDYGYPKERDNYQPLYTEQKYQQGLYRNEKTSQRDHQNQYISSPKNSPNTQEIIRTSTNNDNTELKKNLQKFISEADQLRIKFYKTQQKRLALYEKNRVIERERSQLLNQNEDLRLKTKFLQVELEKLKNEKKTILGKFQDKKQINERNYEEMAQKIDRLNLQIKNRMSRQQNYQRQKNEIEGVLRDQQRQIQRLQKIISIKQDQILDLHERNHDNNKIYKLSNLQLQLKRERNQKEQLMNEVKQLRQKKVNEAKLESELHRAHKKIDQLVKNLKQRQNDIKEKQTMMKQMQQSDNNEGLTARMRMMEKQMQSLSRAKSHIVQEYQNRLFEKQRHIEYLEKQSYQKMMGNRNYPEAKEETFQKVVHDQIQLINKLKEENTEKNNSLFLLKSENEGLKAEINNIHSKNTVLNAQINSMKTSSSGENKNRIHESELKSLNRKLKEADENLQRKKKEVKEKDKFIQSYLVGLSRKEDVPLVIAQLDRILNG